MLLYDIKWSYTTEHMKNVTSVFYELIYMKYNLDIWIDGEYLAILRNYHKTGPHR